MGYYFDYCDYHDLIDYAEWDFPKMIFPYFVRHEMHKEDSTEDYEEWACDYCTFRIRIYYEPIKKEVLDYGDNSGVHDCATGIQIGEKVEQ